LRILGAGAIKRQSSDLRDAMEDECADLFAQVLLFAAWQEIDIEAAVMRKWGQHMPQAEACYDP